LQSSFGQLPIMFWINLRIRERFGGLCARSRCSTCPGEHDICCTVFVCVRMTVIYFKMHYALVQYYTQPCAPPRYASIPVLPVSLLWLIHLVLWSSSPDTGAVDLPLTCCCVDALPKFTRLAYFVYSTLGRGSTLPHALPRCGAPTHLLPSLLLANGELLVSAVLLWSRSLSCFLVRWSVICSQDGCLMAFATGALPEEYLSHNFDEQCLGGYQAYLMPFLL